VADEKGSNRNPPGADGAPPQGAEPNQRQPLSNSRVKFEIFGEEMIEKKVKASGNSGRVYLPPDWVGHKVKIIRVD
jgi:putative transposon-encoded protein